MNVDDLDALSTAVLATPGVARLSAGAIAEVATYLPGRRINGVRMGEDGLEVHVVVKWGRPVPEIADDVRAASRPFSEGKPVSVFVEDIELPSTDLVLEHPIELPAAPAMSELEPAPGRSSSAKPAGEASSGSAATGGEAAEAMTSADSMSAAYGLPEDLLVVEPTGGGPSPSGGEVPAGEAAPAPDAPEVVANPTTIGLTDGSVVAGSADVGPAEDTRGSA